MRSDWQLPMSTGSVTDDNGNTFTSVTYYDQEFIVTGFYLQEDSRPNNYGDEHLFNYPRRCTMTLKLQENLRPKPSPPPKRTWVSQMGLRRPVRSGKGG